MCGSERWMSIDSYRRRVTVADVVIETGLKLNEAQKVLDAISDDTDGFLEVLDGGDILYIFQKGYRSKLAAKSFRMKIEPFPKKAKMYLALHVPVILCITLWMILLYMLPIALGLFFVMKDTTRNPKLDEMNLSQKVISVLFGDGLLNQGIEEKRWKMDDDSYILPVLQRFDGQPKFVDGEGNIFYRFTSLQQRSEVKKCVGRGKINKTFLKEKKWKFGIEGGSMRGAVIFLLGCNLFVECIGGVVVCEFCGPSTFTTYIIPLVQIYAASLFVLSLIGGPINAIINAIIDEKNQARKLRAKALASDSSLRRKILAVRHMAAQRTFIDTSIERIAFQKLGTT